MAIESIKNSVMGQMTRVEPPVPAESIEVGTAVAAQNFSPVVAAQGSGDQSAGQKKQERQGESKDPRDPRDIQEVSPEKVKSAIADINKKILPTHTQCQFKYHEQTRRICITVIDKDTDKVIKEIPPEKTLDMIAKSLELAGLLVDEKR